jgi:hypothetical protein
MRALKPSERQALYLKGLGYTYREIMRLTGSTYTAVNRRITEGRAALRRQTSDGNRRLVLNRRGADQRCERLLRDIPIREGLDRDEYPPAVGRGRGSGLERGRNPPAGGPRSATCQVRKIDRRRVARREA